MSIIDKVNSSADVKKLNRCELDQYCEEVRDFLVDSVSKTGGHLASNLGAVELSVALHRVYDTTKDRLVFDVGHQSYVHKLITGRKDKFSTLRQYGGLSGFPKPYESVDDAFIAGHASNSISVALGMAKARTLAGDKYDVVALIGDGALTGGLAYEGLAGAAASGEPMVIIINDNNMSIDPNVGGTASLLQKMRVRPAYITLKHCFKTVFSKFPKFYSMSHEFKEVIKNKILPGNIFSSMGLNYLGPVNGHDLVKLERTLRLAKEHNGPIVVHVVTQKGKGRTYCEERPELYHGVGAFDPVSGELPASGENFSSVFGKALTEYAAENSKVCAITAAMASGTGLDVFAKAYPNRFVDTGIAEGHAVSMAAGMAQQGAIPVFAVYSSFLQRGYDMLIHDVSLLGVHAVFGLDRSGIVGNDGETHNGVFDVSFLNSVPGMSIYSPASFAELRDMLKLALFENNGPVALRYPRGGEGEYKSSNTSAECIIKEGKDVTIVCYGILVNEALKAAKILEEKGISAEIVKLGVLKPNNFELCMASLRKTGRLVFPEETCSSGCMGHKLLSECASKKLALNAVRLLNLGEGIVLHGKPSELYRDYKLDGNGIAEVAVELLQGD